MNQALNSLPGVLRINLNVRQRAVSIRDERPENIATLLTQCDVPTLMSRLPRLYSLCAIAQQTAAAIAIEQAMQTPASEAVACHRRQGVALESLREHLMHCYLDAPKLCDQSILQSDFAKIMQKLRQLLDQHLREAPIWPAGDAGPYGTSEQWHAALQPLRKEIGWCLFGCTPEEFLSLPAAHIEEWQTDHRGPVSLLLGWLKNRGWQHLGEDQSLCPVPDAFGGLLDRYASHPLLRGAGSGVRAHWLARLIEIASLLCARLPDSRGGTATGGGCGQGLVAAARGGLSHELSLDDCGRVGSYRVWAPTDANFAAEGPAERRLRSLLRDASPTAELERQAMLVINALDPCVGVSLEVRH